MKIILIVVAIIAVVATFKLWMNYQATNLVGDVITHDIDGFLSIGNIPDSFMLNEEQTITYLNGTWGMSRSDVFTYLFYKDQYTNLGGVSERPIVLGIRFYASSTVMQEAMKTTVNQDTLLLPDYNIYRSDFETFPFSEGEIRRTKGISDDKNDATILVYSNTEKQFTLFLYYEERRINDQVAVDILKEIIPTIKMSSSLGETVDRISNEFYEKNPELKEKVGQINIERQKALGLAQAELGKRYPDLTLQGSKLIFHQSYQTGPSLWSVNYQVGGESTGTIEITVDVKTESITAFKEELF